MEAWIFTGWIDAAMVVASVVAVYAVVLLCVRLTGLRSLAKMSATDFVWTVATGSLLATSIVSPSPPILLAAVAFASIFALQWAVALCRRQSRRVERLLDNDPILLMDGATILERNLVLGANVSRAELRAKLREANVLNYDQVRAVVMETTGDISVLHASDPDERFDRDLLEDVAEH